MSELCETPAPAAGKLSRSQFLQKLHSILENPIDPTGLRWVTDDLFEISSKDAVAIHALSPAFDFHSLSSFIRQLSYYSFRRLSDRRRSTERRNSNPGYILFTHPSGFFVRGDPSQLTKIIRKARTRSEKSRRASECSTATDDAYSSRHPYPMPAWPPADYRATFSTDRPTLQLPSFGSSFVNAAASRMDPTQWRTYAPATGSWFDPNRDASDRFGPPRRASLGEFKLSQTVAGQYLSPLSSLHEERPRMRKAISSTCVPTTSSLEEEQQLYDEQRAAREAADRGFRASPYSTPTFSPTTNSFFQGVQTVPCQGYLATGATGAYTTVPQQHSHLSYEPSPFAASYQPVAPSSGKGAVAQSYHTPSPDHSPLQEVLGLPPLAETVPPLGHPAHPATAATNVGQHDARSYALLAPQHQQEESQSPRSSYAPLPPMQSRFSILEPSQHSPWQSAQQPTYTQYAYAPQQQLQSQHQPWSPARIRATY